MKRTVLRIVTFATLFALVLPVVSMAAGHPLLRP